MKDNRSRFSPKIFAILLEIAKGPRSWRQFASDCDISYVQMHKLAKGEQANPPRPKLIKKIADRSFGEIDFEDYMFAAGLCGDGAAIAGAEQRKSDADSGTVIGKYRSLSLKDKAVANAFIEFLYDRSHNERESE